MIVVYIYVLFENILEVGSCVLMAYLRTLISVRNATTVYICCYLRIIL